MADDFRFEFPIVSLSKEVSTVLQAGFSVPWFLMCLLWLFCLTKHAIIPMVSIHTLVASPECLLSVTDSPVKSSLVVSSRFLPTGAHQLHTVYRLHSVDSCKGSKHWPVESSAADPN